MIDLNSNFFDKKVLVLISTDDSPDMARRRSQTLAKLRCLIKFD